MNLETLGHNQSWFPLNDFSIYYLASLLWQLGENPYGISPIFEALKSQLNLSFHGGSGFSYPPASLLIFAPFNLISPQSAAVIWTIIGAGAYIWYALVQINKYRSNRAITIFLATFLPALGSLYVGQVNWLLLILVNAFLVTKHWRRGIYIALAGMIKPHVLLILLPSLIHKKWQTILAALITLVLLSLPFYALTKAYFLTVLPTLQHYPSTYFHLQSFHAFLLRLGHSSNYLEIGLPLAVALVGLKIKRYKNAQYFWLIYASLFAGLNSFNNFIVVLPILLDYLIHWRQLELIQKVMVGIIVSITNGLFFASIIWDRLVGYNGTTWAAAAGSLGMVAMVTLMLNSVISERSPPAKA